MILSSLEALILRAFGLRRCQKGCLKKVHKKEVKEGTRGARVKPSVGVWVPLRRRKGSRKQGRLVDQTRPDVLESTVADTRVDPSISMLVA